MQALCEMHYVHSLQMRKLAFRNEMPQRKKMVLEDLKKIKKAFTPGKPFRDGGSRSSDSE